jgi:hypothetical protein
MQPAQALVPRRVWRVTLADLEDINPWLFPKLLERYPNMNEGGVLHWFRAAISDRATLFIRSDKVVGMFEVRADVLEPRPQVVERFVRMKEPDNDEGLQLYLFAKEWAWATGVCRFDFNVDSDVGMSGYTKGGGVENGFLDPRRDITVKKRSVYTAILR